MSQPFKAMLMYGHNLTKEHKSPERAAYNSVGQHPTYTRIISAMGNAHRTNELYQQWSSYKRHTEEQGRPKYKRPTTQIPIKGYSNVCSNQTNEGKSPERAAYNSVGQRPTYTRIISAMGNAHRTNELYQQWSSYKRHTVAQGRPLYKRPAIQIPIKGYANVCRNPTNERKSPERAEYISDVQRPSNTLNISAMVIALGTHE